MRWVCPLALLSAIVARSGRSSAEPAEPPTLVHVLADRAARPGGEASQRALTFVVERGGDCVAADRLAVAPPFVGAVAGACAVTLRGPATAQPVVTLDGAPLGLPPAPAADPPPPPPASTASAASPSWAVTPTTMIPVGEVTTAAEVWVVADGKPTSTVELNVRADGARLRALRWRRTGQASVDVVVPTWRPTIELIIQLRGGAETRTVIAVDPGPPIDATVRVGQAQAGRPFAAVATVATASGAPFDLARIRIAAAGCAAAGDLLTCARPGPALLVVHIEHAGTWVPLAHATIDVAVPPSPPRPRPPAPPARPSSPPALARLGWEIAARGAGAPDGLWSGGLIGGVTYPVWARLDATLGVGWQFGRARLTPVAPVTEALTLSEHQLELRGGVVARLAGGRPWTVRIAGGPIAVRQRGAMGDGGWIRTGLRVHALAAVGARLGLGARTLSIDVGASVAADVAAPGWSRPDRQVFVEVGLAGRR